MSKIAAFFKLPAFAVVGASNNKEKFGNKVFRMYQNHGKYVIPISKSSVSIEEVPCVDSLTSLRDKIQMTNDAQSPLYNMRMQNIGVSIITPPAVTRQILEEGLSLGYRQFFLQPGTVDVNVAAYMTEQTTVHSDACFIENCVLVQLPLQSN